ncbi:MAG TPA: Gfo/Idh/MocA family oxidoreductase [Candidatus Limnocylindrales bacterium]|nr:Gfo/Idh/MocA family oxidoreductase [Candidatus Limnocylindrales bacterium]
MKKLRWGVLGVARIATAKVIPAMQQGALTEMVGIASRDGDRARKAAKELGIPKAYGSYEEMLADREIDVIYNPLPNHLHVPWSIKAAEAGKHVLCEKPVAMNAAEARELIAARDRTGVTMGEAFMIQVHPQWVRTMELARTGKLGEMRAVFGSFGYFKLDADNIRNIREYGGGGLMDIGCYPIKCSRMVFAQEPVRVAATIVRDARFGGIDTLTSAVLEFPAGHCVFTCGTQVAANQTMQVLGSAGKVELEIPFNAPPNEVTRIKVNGETEEFAPCDQYTLQGDAFSRAVMEGGEPPVPLEDALRTMRVVDAVFEAADTGKWVATGLSPGR